jgi:phosphoribosyl-ATP pyrophosphohydrolase
MLRFELDISKIKSDKKNLLKIDNNFIINYAKSINLFGSIIINNSSSNVLIKQVCSVAECYLMMNSPNLESIKLGLQMGVKKFIIPEKEIDKINKFVSKNIIVARITLEDKSIFNNDLNSFGDQFNVIFNRLKPYCSEFLIDWDNNLNLSRNTVLKIADYISGIGTTQLTLLDPDGQNSKELENKGINPFVISSNLFSEKEMLKIFTSVLDFNKQDGFIPTIVQDDHNQILMLAYSTKDSLTQALIKKQGIYFSRSRKSLWIKGETTGNYQELYQARYDCDQDTLLFTVNQLGSACHLQRYSCFDDKNFGFLDLYEIIQDRIKNPIPDSYTSKISKSEGLIIEKIREESNELVNYVNQENLVWEIADLLYFILILMAKKEIKIKDILNELRKRRNYGN